MTSHVLRVVLQTGHKFFDLFALKADLVDRREQGKPAEDIQVNTGTQEPPEGRSLPRGQPAISTDELK